MIVLDEQLSKKSLTDAIAKWYPGAVCSVTDLRPKTIIKDEAIPTLLGRVQEPTFVTINEADFWLRTSAVAKFCLVCVALPDERIRELPALLQRLLRHPDFKTKALRVGKVVRLTTATAQYYSINSSTVQTLEKW